MTNQTPKRCFNDSPLREIIAEGQPNLFELEREAIPLLDRVLASPVISDEDKKAFKAGWDAAKADLR